jgi:hypothetical protein
MGPRITKQKIIEDLQKFENKYKKIPTRREYNKYGQHSPQTVSKLFITWNNALKEIFGKTNIQGPHPNKLLQCKTCNKKITIKYSETRKSKSGYNFCSRSCAATYNNKLKKKSRRSKIEIRLFELLKKTFPCINFLPNDKTMLNGLEVDIAIPELKLAIEWNGVVHFKPIYGETKLNRIQSIDKKKLLLAQQKNINLIVISDNTSSKKQFDEAFSQIYKIIKELSS